MGQRSPEARYQEIERWLRRRVLASAPGDPLPSEAELATQFGVSRMTARQEVQILAAEGLVQRRRGAGTFVTPRPIHSHEGSLMSFTEDMRRRGMKASSRLRLADGVPLAIEHAALPSDCAGVLADDLETGSLHDSLVARGFVPTISRAWIRARAATAAVSRLLEIPPRSALLVERRIIYDSDGLPLEHTESAYNGDNYAIDAVFSSSRAASLPRNAAPAAPA